MPCENSKQARVYYRDDKGNWQNFNSYNPGVSLTVTREKGANCLKPEQTWKIDVPYIACSDLEFSRKTHPDHSYCWDRWTLKAGGSFIVLNRPQAACGIAYKQSAIISGTFVGRWTYTATIDAAGDFTITGKFQSQGAAEGYRLKITDKRGQVFDGGFQEKDPTPRIECGESCPPNSCECACGAMINCYGPTGQLVKRFSRVAKG